MLTFRQWLKLFEDFKSATPFQGTVPKSNEKVNIFYERVYHLNLVNYLRSFQNNQAKQYFPAPSYLRGLVYSDDDSFLVFVFKGGMLHKDVAEILSSGQVKLPHINYLEIYTEAYRSNKIDVHHWCLPCYIEDGKVGIYLDKTYLTQLEPLDAPTKLGFSDSSWKTLLKNSGKA